MGSEFIYVNGVKCERQYTNHASEIGKLAELFKNVSEGKFAVRVRMATTIVCDSMMEAYKKYNDFA